MSEAPTLVKRRPQYGGSGLKVMTGPQVADLIGLSVRGLWLLRQWDITFPKPFRPLGPKGHPRWLRTDVETWLRRKQREAQTQT